MIKNRAEEKKHEKCQSLSQERNSGHPEYKNDNLIFIFFYIFINEALATKAW
jgi:hypothetical protein